MIHGQHADAAARRLSAVIEARQELAQLAEKPGKSADEWARISELRLQLQLAYDGAGVHAALAVYGAVNELTAALDKLSESSAREVARQLAEAVQGTQRAGSADERRRQAARDARP